MNSTRRRGVVVLPTILIFSAIILGIVLAGLFIVQLINRSNFGIRLAAESVAAANAAIDDVHLRLIRDNLSPIPTECNDVSPVFTTYDTLTIGRVNVTQMVCKYTCGVSACRYRIRADAVASSFVKRRYEALMDSDQVTGQIRVGSVKAIGF